MPKVPKPPIPADLKKIIASAIKEGLEQAGKVGNTVGKEISEVAGAITGRKIPKGKPKVIPMLDSKGAAIKQKPKGITAPKNAPKSAKAPTAPKTATSGMGGKPPKPPKVSKTSGAPEPKLPKPPKLSASGQVPKNAPPRPKADRIPDGKNLPTTNAEKRAAEKQANFLTKDIKPPRGRPMGDRSNTSGPVTKGREKMSSIPKLDKAAQNRAEIARDRALFTTKGPRSVVTASSEMERLKSKLASAKPDRKDYWAQRIKEAKGK